MNKITFPLKQGIQGSRVGDLQDALQLLLDKAIILRENEAANRELSSSLRPERLGQLYGSTTHKMINIFGQGGTGPANRLCPAPPDRLFRP